MLRQHVEAQAGQKEKEKSDDAKLPAAEEQVLLSK